MAFGERFVKTSCPSLVRCLSLIHSGHAFLSMEWKERTLGLEFARSEQASLLRQRALGRVPRFLLGPATRGSTSAVERTSGQASGVGTGRGPGPRRGWRGSGGGVGSRGRSRSASAAAARPRPRRRGQARAGAQPPRASQPGPGGT